MSRETSKTSVPVPELIRAKRDGQPISAADLRALVLGFTRGEVPDYQMSAFAMAVFFQGMTRDETAALTLAMRDSGAVVPRGSYGGVAIDKHSTGGVGDKVSVCLAPLVACTGVRVPMISGRGLGHTGGTVDKLHAIPGFETALSMEGFVRQTRELGFALAGQSGELAPADRGLYALRDVTATVESIPLITASILSKKLAEGLDGLVLDVKVGRGAFMKSEDDARALARSLVQVGRAAGTTVSAVLTAMDAPLGLAIGNALETAEAIALLHDRAPDDLMENTLVLGAEMLRLAGLESSRAKAEKRLLGHVRDGSARAKLGAAIEAQGGDARIVEEPDRLPSAPVRVRVATDRAGFVLDANAMELGLCAMELGAGRATITDVVEPSVGIVLARKPGDRVVDGDVLATVHARSREDADAVVARVHSAFRIGARAPAARPFVLGQIRG